MWYLEHILRFWFYFFNKAGKEALAFECLQNSSLWVVNVQLPFPFCLQTVGNSLAAPLLTWLCTSSTVVGGATQLASTLPWPYGASASFMWQFKEKGSFLRCYCFCSEFAKEYIYVCVYIYIIINHPCPWESLEWIENLFHCNIDCIEAHCLSTEETKRLCISFWYYVPPLLFWNIHVLKLYSI